MEWTQKKICNYLWKNNWFASHDNQHSENLLDSFYHNNYFRNLLKDTLPVLQYTGSEAEWKSYTLEIAFHDRQMKKNLMSYSGWKEKYFLYFNFLQMSSYEKAKLADKITGGNLTEVPV